MIEEPQLFGSLALASHRNGSPIKLPRAQDEVAMLAFDRRNSRLVELHICTGKTAPVLTTAQPTAVRRWVKPLRWQSRRMWSSSRLGGRKLKAAKPGVRRQPPRPRIRPAFLHRFYDIPVNLEQAGAKPEIIDADQQLRICNLLRASAALRGPSFMTILDVGMDDGLAYYVTHLNDGEFVQEYVRRRGAVPTVTSLALVHQLLQDLVRAKDHGQLLSSLSLDRVLVTSQEEEYLQLRIFDYGLSQPRSSTSAQDSARLVVEACQLLFLLMTGQAYSGGNPDDLNVIAELPASLRFLIKSVLTSCPFDLSTSIKALRDEIREAMCSYVTLVQARNPKMLLVADTSTLPLSHLQTLLLGEVPLKTLFGASFEIQNPELSGCHPFAISAVNVAAGQPVTLHLLPPERIVRDSGFMALPPQIWRQDPARQTNLLHMMSLWKGSDWAFLSETREPGMSLSALMAKRGTLNPGEVIILLRQIHAGLEQALETGVQHVDLDPSNIQLCVGYDGPVLPRDLERLHQKRLDAWPKFVVKIRLHKTMRSLCKPRLINPGPSEFSTGEEPTGAAAREERYRSFICLAAFLLTGRGQMREIAAFPTSMPELAAGYVHESLQHALHGSTVPSPPEFTEKFSQMLTAATAEMDSVEDPLAVLDPPAMQEMESAGFVSDFEEDWTEAETPAPTDLGKKTLRLAPASKDLQSLDFHRPSPPRSSFPWLALAAMIMLLGGLAWMIFGDFSHASAGMLSVAPSSQPQQKVASQKEASLTQPSQTFPQPVIHKTPVLGAEASVTPQLPAKVAEVPSPALPQVAVTSSMAAAPTPESSVPAVVAEAPAAAPQPADKKMEAAPAESQLAASDNTATGSQPAEVEPVIRRAIPATSADIISPQPAQPAKEVAAQTPATPAAAQPQYSGPVVVSAEPQTISSSPPAEVAKLQEVTVRHAIVLTPEEINETLRAQTKARKGNSRRK